MQRLAHHGTLVTLASMSNNKGRRHDALSTGANTSKQEYQNMEELRERLEELHRRITQDMVRL